MCRIGLCALPFISTLATAQQWTLIHEVPLQRGDAVYDTRRERLVHVGWRARLHEYDGTAMHQPPFEVSQTAPGGFAPSSRYGASIAYDAANDQIVMFGGLRNALLGDTWILQGREWRPLSQIVPPPRRRNAAITYDPRRQRVVMFGGSGDNGALRDTWEFDGATWTQQLPATTPPGGEWVTMDYDLARGRSVLFVAEPAGTGVFSWDGVNWTGTPMTPQRLLEGAKAVYDAGRARFVLIGGLDFTFSPASSNTIAEWDGVRWTTVTTPERFAQYHSVWFDPGRNSVMVGGPAYDATGAPISAIWSYSGTGLQRALDIRDPGFGVPSTFRDPVAGQVVWLGATARNATYLWDGVAWTETTPTITPAPRSNAMTATDYTTGRGFLFGGDQATTTFDDLWSWSNGAWAPIATQNRPPARINGVLAFDESRGRLVLHGGVRWGTVGVSSVYSDTWEFDGTNWIDRTQSVRPASNWGAAMAYDSQRNRCVFFGGIEQGVGFANEHWEWDGTTWSQIPNAAGPQASGAFVAMAYDRLRNRMMLRLDRIDLFGQNETWEYDGTQWTNLAFQAPLITITTVWDETRGRVAGFGPTGMVSEWTTQAAQTASYGTGCGTPAPRLWVNGQPRIGVTDFELQVDASPGTMTILAVSFARANAPITSLPGCTALIGAPAAIVGRIANSTRKASQVIPLPLTTSLRGLQFFAQAVALAPATGAISLSRGLELSVGD